MDEPPQPENHSVDDENARTLGVLGLVAAFLIFPAAIFLCIEALYRTDGSRGPNWPAIAGLLVSLAVASLLLIVMLHLSSEFGECWRECD